MRLAEKIPLWLDLIAAVAERRDDTVRLMEVCGTHTMSIFRSGIPSLLPDNLKLLSGPGCPVCVTSQGDIDRILAVAQLPVVTCSYGDMLRVPGQDGSLESARAKGSDVCVVYSALDSVRMAQAQPTREFVFAAVGFETTAPATAAAVLEARRLKLRNWSVMCSHKRVVPALHALFAADTTRIDGILLPGHVSVILGSNVYRALPSLYDFPMVIAGFEDWQIVEAVARLMELAAGRQMVLENMYPEVVTPEGSIHAQQLLRVVFQLGDAEWRGLGNIPDSGLILAPAFDDFDAGRRYGVRPIEGREHPACRCGEIITGLVQPSDCKLFGTACTPVHPLGPCMVSSEGTCQAWFKYHRHEVAKREAAKL